MTINTVETNSANTSRREAFRTSRFRISFGFRNSGFGFRGGLSCLLLTVLLAQGQPVLGPWIPIFKGIDRAVGTNTPGLAGNFPELQVVHCVRIDLTDPDIRLFATPKAANYTADYRETLTQTVPQFLSQNKLQVAADANFYSANPGGSDPSGSGIPCEVFGLQISGGVIVSAQSNADAAGDPRYATLLFSTNNQPHFSFVNRPPGTNTAGILTAITGYYPIVSNGVNIGAASINAYPDSWIHQQQPRTAFGVSQDNRYLFLINIDGRQSGYSDGALDSETAYWLIQAGAWNGINMDGGGSTSLYMSDSTGNPVPLNHSSYVAAYGHERYIGSHFGVYAKPLPGFLNNINVQPNDTAATITWDTLAPGTTQVQYGLSTNLGSSTALSSALVTNHAALLTGLAPSSGYYYQVQSTDNGGSLHTSPLYVFVTTNYVMTNLLFDLNNTWSYSTDDGDGVNWQAPGYDDSGWATGPGVLWVDARGDVQPGIPSPNTQMSTDPGTGYPFITYYFRTHFAWTNALAGASLLVEAYIDDGAVFYLNGNEVSRQFMVPYPTPITNGMLAIGYACTSGNATCPVTFVISGDLVTNLVAGDNVLAVEVHNYSATSPDVTFGMTLSYTEDFVGLPQLNIVGGNGMITLSWNQGGFILQQADSLAGSWADLPGPIFTSPCSIPAAAAAKYYRLRK